MKKHISGGLWLLVFFFLISAALSEHHWLWLILSIITFLTDVLIFNTAPVWLRIDRMLVGENKSWILDILRPILFFAIVCLFIFDLMFCVLSTAHQNPSRSQLFADMVSPVSLRSSAYSPRDSANTIEAKLLLADSVSYTSTEKYPKLIATGTEKYNPRHFFLLAILYLFGSVFIMGFFIASIKQIFDSRVTKYKDGQTSYGRLKNHYVILGYGEIAIPIIQSIDKNDPEAFIILLTEQNVHRIRPLLEERKSNNHILVYAGDIELDSNLRKLRIDKASEVYILGEGVERGRDAKNIALIPKIKERRIETKRLMNVFVQLDKPSSYSTIKRLSFTKKLCQEGKCHLLNIRAFNYYENCARQLWGYWGNSLGCNRSTISLDRDELVPGSPKHVQLVIAGFGSMGKALLLEALRVCHFPNSSTNTKTQICVVDPKMDDILPSFKAQYPELYQILDVNIEYQKASLEDTEIRQRIVQWSTDDNTLLNIAVCLSDPDQSLSCSLGLPDEVYYLFDSNSKSNPHPNTHVQILMSQETSNQAMENLIKGSNGKYWNVNAFGMTNTCYDDGMMSDIMPIWINEFYYHTQQDSNGKLEKGYENKINNILDQTDTAEYKKLFDQAKLTWVELTEDFKYANRYQVDMYGVFMRYKNKDNVSKKTLMRMEHARWMADRALIGYKHTEEKYTKYKLHPCMKDFDNLSEEYKTKDEQVINNLELVQKLYDFHKKNISTKPKNDRQGNRRRTDCP